MEQVKGIGVKTFTQYIRQLSRPKIRTALKELDSDTLAELMTIYIDNEHYELCSLIRDELSNRHYIFASR